MRVSFYPIVVMTVPMRLRDRHRRRGDTEVGGRLRGTAHRSLG